MPLLNSSKMVGFVCAKDPARAKAFYGGVLGLPLVSEDWFAAVFNANGNMLRVVHFPGLTPQQFTVLGWEVADIVAAITEMAARGVAFERFPGLPQDELGIWTAPGGDRVAWFKDPDGNVLSLSKHA